jgi:phage gp46-like protein
MADLLLQWDQAQYTADLVIENGDLVLDQSLYTPILLSLMQDATAPADIALPDGTTNRRGYWADYLLTPLPDGSADVTGSLLWLLARAIQTTETLRQAETYAKAALAWMIDDGVIGSVDATATYPATGQMLLQITVNRAGSSETYDFMWNASSCLSPPQT